AHCNLGVVLLQRGAVAPACEHLRASVRLHPDNIDYRRYLARGLSVQGDWDAAAEQCEQILKRDRQYAEAWYRLGEVRAGQGRLTEAHDCLEQARKLHYNAAPTLALLGHVLWQEGRYDDAAACWREALRTNAGEPEALLGQGMVELRAGRLSGA